MKRAEFEATCLLCGLEEFVLVFDLNVGQWTMLGTHLLPVADVCSKGQGGGDHFCAGGLDSTLVVAAWYFGRSGALPAWGLM